jgi:uncharacterized damage-inducible protein DinB
MATRPDGGRPRSGSEAQPELRVPRPDEESPADEMTMARGWLVHLRESAIPKLEGVDDDQVLWKTAPSANSLGSIVVHLGYAERLWLRVISAGEIMDMSWRGKMFVVPEGWHTHDIVTFYRDETTATDVVLDGTNTMDLRSTGEIRPTTLRRVVTHLLEETARHVGHMDITREFLDGSTGR